ncbi:uncharacterized protein LOC113008692 [Astatotilapia calliptera]|uniref:uncharacterized protein LOC113008692 n=1 Tax=Astatotilapia calliptera TaxID=8154 RepID=UPI000E422E3A|nr:uncharacterized protein LOC113008692 [Astatotilapia calliptera]
MVNAITRLTEKRQDCGVLAENIFLFARPHCLTPYRGQDCLRIYATECGAENPEHLRSTQLRKHVATLSQILNLKNHELDQVANFLGHDIRVHREYYRLPEATTQLAKISKLLIAMEKGSLKSLQGKTLEEIEIEDNLQLTDSSEESEVGAEREEVGAEREEVGAEREEVGAEREEVGAEREEVGAEREVNEGNLVYPQIDSIDTRMMKKVVKEPPAQSKNGAGKVIEPNRILNKEMKPSSKKKTNEQSASLENARRVKKHPWSPTEVAAIMNYFGEHIKKGKLATIIECQQCKTAEDPALAGRSIQNIRDFVRNRGVSLKKKENPM